MRRREERDDARANAGPPLLRAALENLRDVALKRLEENPNQNQGWSSSWRAPPAI